MIALSAALAPAYGSSRGPGRTAATLEMLMIEPRPAAFIRSPNSALSRNGALKFTAMTLSKSSSVISPRLGYSGDIPALLTSTSTRSNASYDVSTRASRSDQRPTWHATGTTVRPVSPVIASAARSQASSLRLATTTSAPACANAVAIASPRPLLPPVTTATCPANVFVMGRRQ